MSLFKENSQALVFLVYLSNQKLSIFMLHIYCDVYPLFKLINSIIRLSELEKDRQWLVECEFFLKKLFPIFACMMLILMYHYMSFVLWSKKYMLLKLEDLTIFICVIFLLLVI